MVNCKGVVRHADSRVGDQRGSFRLTRIEYRKSDVEVMVPAKGSRQEVIQCVFCHTSLNVLINCHRRAALIYVLKSMPWLAVVDGDQLVKLFGLDHHGPEIEIVGFGKPYNSAVPHNASLTLD
jgi:hypothetical protein